MNKCDTCKYENKEPHENPCNCCKNNVLPCSEEYYTTPYKWEPKGIEEKREAVRDYCNDTSCSCCVLDEQYLSKDADCIDIDLADEASLDKALVLIEQSKGGSFNDIRESVGLDPIKPDYYNDTKIAPIDVIEDWDLDFCLGSALKYIKRCGKKENNPSVQDLKKVIWYVERRIKELEEVNERDKIRNME